MELKKYYEGFGVNKIDFQQADTMLDRLFYTAQNKPHMWWDKSGRKLTMEFNIYDHTENRLVQSNDTKLRILCKKVTADFMQHTKASIAIEYTKIPMTVTY